MNFETKVEFYNFIVYYCLLKLTYPLCSVPPISVDRSLQETVKIFVNMLCIVNNRHFKHFVFLKVKQTLPLESYSLDALDSLLEITFLEVLKSLIGFIFLI